MTIAQCFSVGKPAAPESSPEGTAEDCADLCPISRPFGTCVLSAFNPTLKRWAILGMSLRDKDVPGFPKSYTAKPTTSWRSGL